MTSRGLVPERRADQSGRVQTRWVRAAFAPSRTVAEPPPPALPGPSAELAELVDAAHGLVLSGWKPVGLTPQSLRSRLQMIADAAPDTLDHAVAQWEAADVLGRLWGRAFKAALLPANPEDYADRLPETLEDWRVCAVVYPAAHDMLTLAWGGARLNLAAIASVRGWIRRVERATLAGFDEAELEALTVLSALDVAPEDLPTRRLRHFERDRAALMRVGRLARKLASRVEQLKQVLPELLRRGAGPDEALIEALLDADSAVPALSDGTL